MAITRLVARWTGFVGAPGYTNFFFEGAGTEIDNHITAVENAFSQWIRALPTVVTVELEDEYAILDEVTGQITGYVPSVVETVPHTGLDAGVYAGPTGGVVNWNTATVRNGRRMRGRTFLVPLSGESFQSDGSLASDTLGILRDGANALLNGAGSSQLVVWGRPQGGSGGVSAPVTGFSVPDMAAVLRSRRD